MSKLTEKEDSEDEEENDSRVGNKDVSSSVVTAEDSAFTITDYGWQQAGKLTAPY